MVDAEEILEIEPNATGLRALHSPATAIVDYPAVTRALAADFESRGGVSRLNTAVTGVTERSTDVPVDSGGDTDSFDTVIACAGLQPDRLAVESGESRYPDFASTGTSRVLHVRNAPSPGATSSLAIAEHIVGEANRRAS